MRARSGAALIERKLTGRSANFGNFRARSERQYAFQSRERWRARHDGAVSHQEDMADDFCLLLDAIASEGPSWPYGVTIAAEGVPAQEQVNALLMLPHMDEFVNEVALLAQRSCAEAFAIAAAGRMEVDMATGRHRHVPRLQRPPFSSANPDGIEVQRSAEHLPCEASFRFAQRAFSFVYQLSGDHEFANGLVTAMAQEPFARSAAARRSETRIFPEQDARRAGGAKPYVERRNALNARLSY